MASERPRSRRRELSHLFPAALFALAAACCGSPDPADKERPAPPELESHTIAFGGDLILGRRLNEAVLDARHRRRLLGDLKRLLAAADLAVINGEGVVSGGGRFTYKGESQSYMYRAHPQTIDLLRESGIDVVMLGNNHSGDYGPWALREMLDRLRAAGIGYAGAGYDLDDACRPVYRRLGDTVVAVVGADLTRTRPARARKNRPGTCYHDLLEDDPDDAFETLKKALDEARRHAHVVLLGPHWGDNWKRRPQEPIRELARRLIAAGFDGIVGHSAHYFQGAELIEGRPVIYDAGNLVLDYGGDLEEHRAFLWELEIDRSGVSEARATPLRLKRNRVTRAGAKRGREMLSDLKQRCSDLDTESALRDGKLVLSCRPGGVAGPRSVSDPPLREKPDGIRSAPTRSIVAEPPPGAERCEVSWENGVSLVGKKLLLDAIPPGSGQFVALWWKTDRRLEEGFKIHLEARHLRRGKSVGSRLASHLPGDWLLPAERWPAGKPIEDWTLFRLYFPPKGEVGFYTGLWNGKKMLRPSESSLPVGKDGTVELGRTPYRKDAPAMFDVLERWRAE